MKDVLSKYANIIKYSSLSYDITEQQIAIEKENKIIQGELADDAIKEVIAEIRVLSSIDYLNDSSLKVYIRQSKRNKKIFLERFIRLYKYADLDSLLHNLWEIRTNNLTSFKNLNNAVMFWALADEHPFKTAVRKVFTINQVYTATEIQTLLIPIIQYHLHKILAPRKYISFFKSLYKVERPQNKYIIKEENPLHLKEHSFRIMPTDSNLLKYFIL